MKKHTTIIKQATKINLLDWLILVSVIILVFVVYTPVTIWNEESSFRSRSRDNMLVINDAQFFFHELTGNYTSDTTILFNLVGQCVDSLKVDSLYFGSRSIKINRSSYNMDDTLIRVDIDRDFHDRVDTTFSAPVNLYIDKIDTIYTVLMMSEVEEIGSDFDTLYVNNDRLGIYTEDDYNFKGVIDTNIVSRSEKITDYYRNKFELSSQFLYCPVSKSPYVLTIDTLDNKARFSVKSPLDLEYSERRYIFFKFYAGDHGSITNGYTSWVK